MSFPDIYKADLLSVLKDTGDTVEYNGITSYGFLLNEATDVLTMGKQFSILDTSVTLTIATGSLGPIRVSKSNNNEYILVNKIRYKIDRYILLNNGQETKMWLSGTQS